MNRKSFVWNTIGLTFNAFTSLFFLVIVNRVNGANDAGLFSYAFSLACLFYVIALYYNRTYQVADVNEEYSKNQYITNRMITSFFSILAIVFFSLINCFSFRKLTFICLLMLFKVLEAVSDCFYAFIQKRDKLDYVGKSLFFKAVFGVGIFILIDFLTKNLALSIIGLVIVNLIGLLVDFFYKYKKLYDERIIFELKKAKQLLKETFPLFFFSFLTIYLCNTQKYILEYLMTEEFQNVLGIIIMPATMLSLCGQYLITPYLNELSILYYKNNVSKIANIMHRIMFLFLGFGFIIFIIALLIGIPVLNIIYSIDLTDYKMAFLIIIVGAIFYALTTIISSCLTIFRKNKHQLCVYVISSIFSSIVSFILINIYGIDGASMAYIITMIVHFILMYLLYKWTLKSEIST